MYVVFDTSEYGVLRFILFTQDQEFQKIVSQKNKELLREFDIFLQEHGHTIQDITAIAVVVGVGSFTSTRIAVTVANMFAYTNDMLVSSIASKSVYTYSELTKLFTNIKKHHYIHAIYSSNPYTIC